MPLSNHPVNAATDAGTDPPKLMFATRAPADPASPSDLRTPNMAPLGSMIGAAKPPATPADPKPSLVSASAVSTTLFPWYGQLPPQAPGGFGPLVSCRITGGHAGEPAVKPPSR